MKLPADQYYCVYFCMLEEPAMFKPLSYSSIRHYSSVFVTFNWPRMTSGKKIDQAVQFYYMSMTRKSISRTQLNTKAPGNEADPRLEQR